MTDDFSVEMNSGEPQLLYLGFAFPPGVHELFPGINPAGHALETQMVARLRDFFHIRSAGVLPFDPPAVMGADPSSGIAHELLLLERPPELLHRWRSLGRLKRQYRAWLASGWVPDVLLVYNLSPIYNAFLRWLRRRPECPKLVLLLLDSPTLGRELAWLKRVRRRCKPMCIPDSQMLPLFDGCIGLSRATEHYFRPLGIPFIWMPGGCVPARALRDGQLPGNGHPPAPIRFGYYGALGPHAGVKKMAEAFLASDLSATLQICGYGKAASEIAQLAARDQRLQFRGLLTPSECLQFGRECDVLVNPRPASHGNENNFASKLFDYALSGRAILTSRLSGVESVLGPQAYYFDAYDFDRSLTQELKHLASTPQAELHRRGAAIQEKVLSEFSWRDQGRRLAEFLERIRVGKNLETEAASALAA